MSKLSKLGAIYLTLCLSGTDVKQILHISIEDVAVTRQIVSAGKLLDVQVLDHLVIGGHGRWTSLRERGLGFEG